jgi:hypothetical protein
MGYAKFIGLRFAASDCNCRVSGYLHKLHPREGRQIGNILPESYISLRSSGRPSGNFNKINYLQNLVCL